jgi:Ca2+/H+ antiporter
VNDKKKFFNIIPAAATGVLLALLAVPLLPPGLSHNIMALDHWQSLNEMKSGIVAISTLICLLFLWTSRPKHDDKHKKRKH